MATRVTFKAKGGVEVHGEVVEPEDGKKHPTVVVLHEWWGVNDHIRSILERLAKEGFVAMAPDLYNGAVATTQAEAQVLMNGLDWGKALDAIQGAAKFLQDYPRGTGEVGVIGFCMGGALAFAAGTKVVEFAAIVPFYGIPDAAKIDCSLIRTSVQAHFSKTDTWAKPELAKAVQKKLEGQGMTMELHLYDAEHAFMNDTRPEVYNPAAAKLAWSRAIEFMHEHLG